MFACTVRRIIRSYSAFETRALIASIGIMLPPRPRRAGH